MTDGLLGQVTPMGNYIAIWKLIIFLIFFLLWAWEAQWLDKDAKRVRTNRTMWNGIYMGAGLGSIFLWFVIPGPFWIGMPIFLVAWIIVGVCYVLHRNARVGPEERILTLDHLKYLLTRGNKPAEHEARLVFYSSHKNQLPIPHRQAPEFQGFVLAEELMYDMIYRRVSIARGVPGNEAILFQYTIDGVPSNAGEQDRQDAEQALTYLKAVAGLDVGEKRRPQQGKFSTEANGHRLDWNLQTAGSTRGEQLRIARIEAFETKMLDTLGLHADQFDRLGELIKQPGGIVLVSGPPGSGVTTTLYAIIRKHDGYTQNLHGLEKESLADLDNVTQHKVEDDPKATSNARRLQSVLLGDPDVVMVGFCDEPEMAHVGTESALNGKKLYFSMTAPSAFHALSNWMEMIGNSAKVTKTLRMVINQRLVRKLCPECRQAYKPDPGLLKKLNLPADRIKHFYRPPTEMEYDKRGNPILCEVCQGTGYCGRTAVFETLDITDTIRQLIAENKPFNMIRAQSRKEKTLFLQEQAIRKVIEGITSIQEVLRVTAEKPAGEGAERTATPAQ